MFRTPFQTGKGWDAHKYWRPSESRFMVDGRLKWCITRVASSLSLLFLPPYDTVWAKARLMMATIGGGEEKEPSPRGEQT